MNTQRSISGAFRFLSGLAGALYFGYQAVLMGLVSHVVAAGHSVPGAPPSTPAQWGGLMLGYLLMCCVSACWSLRGWKLWRRPRTSPSSRGEDSEAKLLIV